MRAMRSIYWQVYDLLRGAKVMDANELYSALRRRIPDLTRRELDDVLLKMESAGFIAVVQVSRDQRRVELLERPEEAAQAEEGAEPEAPEQGEERP